MSNFKLGKFQYSFLETTTSGGTLNLPADCEYFQVFLGSASHTAVLPNATLVAPGESLFVVNKSTGSIAVQNFGGAVIGTVGAGSVSEFFLAANGTANGTWLTYASGATGISGIWSIAPGTSKASAARAMFSGGKTTAGGDSSAIEFLTFTTAATVSSFGALTVPRLATAAAGSGTRGLVGGGDHAGTVANIDQFQFDTAAAATNFGNLSKGRANMAGFSNAVRALWAGGTSATGPDSGYDQIIDYSTIASAGNTLSFGNMTTTLGVLSGCASNVRGLIMGGSNGSGTRSTAIQYVAIATTATAQSFGSLASSTNGVSAASNPIIGLMFGGNNGSVIGTIVSVTIATLSNSATFGSLTVARRDHGSAASQTTAVVGGGDTTNGSEVWSAVVDSVKFSSGGAAADFGAGLSVARGRDAGCSSAHGGLN